MFLDMTYPVGAIYMSVNATSLATLFGGSWEAIQGRFLIGTNSTYTPGSTGGEATHTLTVSEMPSHMHQFGIVKWNSNGTDAGPIYSMPSVYTTETANVYTRPASGSGASPYTAKGNTRIWNEGGSVAHNNMPPYLAVYMWKRIG